MRTHARVATSYVVLLSVLALALGEACRSRDIPLGGACPSYGARSDHDCAEGLECVLVAGDAGATSVCTLACKTARDCARLGAGYSCSPPLTHSGMGGCFR